MMTTPGPFRPGRKVTAGQLNDATQKTVQSIDVNIDGFITGAINTVETTIPELTLGPFDQVDGALYRVQTRVIIQQSLSTDEFFLIMRKGTPLTGTRVASWNMWKVPAPNSGNLFTGWADIPATADETGVIYYFSAVRFSGAGDLVIYGHHPTDPNSITPTGVAFTRVGYASEYTVVT